MARRQKIPLRGLTVEERMKLERIWRAGSERASALGEPLGL
jgi:hypothetical protein